MALASSNPAPEDPSDPWLIAAARAGSTDALGTLYERHAGALLAVAYRLLQSVPDAEDVVHDVFVGLPEALRRYQERGTFTAWLRTVTVRVALARLRRAASRDVVPFEAAGEPAAPRRSLEDAITLETALRGLAPGLRAVLVLKEIEGFSHGEIAQLLDISVGASEVRRHRAIAALRAALTPPQDQR